MRYILTGIALPLFLMACSPEPKTETPQKPTADLNLLVDFMKGFYSSEHHARRDTNIDGKVVAYEPIWKSRTDGAWLYVEQARLEKPQKPYRQRIYHLQQQSDSTFSVAIFKIPNDSLYIGSHRDPSLLTDLQPEQLEIMDGCGIHLVFRGDVFVGGTQKRTCKTTYNGAAYLVNETTIYHDSIISWDRGYSDSGEKVWGGEKGGSHYVKMASGM